jgi:hypothetical protein
LGRLRSRSTAGRRKARVLPINGMTNNKMTNDKCDTYPSPFLLVPRDPGQKVLTKKKVNAGDKSQNNYGTSSVAANERKYIFQFTIKSIRESF